MPTLQIAFQVHVEFEPDLSDALAAANCAMATVAEAFYMHGIDIESSAEDIEQSLTVETVQGGGA